MKLPQNNGNSYENIDELFLATLENDDERIQALSFIKDEEVKAKIICMIEEYDKKIEALKLLKNEVAMARVIATLEGDAEKLDLLKDISSIEAKTMIIVSLKSDSEKIKFLESMNFKGAYQYYKLQIIMVLENDDDKMKYLNSIDETSYNAVLFDRNMAAAICTLKNDDNKSKLLERYDLLPPYMGYVIESLESDDKKLELARKIENMKVRYRIVRSLKNPDNKVKGSLMLDGDCRYDVFDEGEEWYKAYCDVLAKTKFLGIQRRKLKGLVNQIQASSGPEDR